MSAATWKRNRDQIACYLLGLGDAPTALLLPDGPSKDALRKIRLRAVAEGYIPAPPAAHWKKWTADQIATAVVRARMLYPRTVVTSSAVLEVVKDRVSHSVRTHGNAEVAAAGRRAGIGAAAPDTRPQEIITALTQELERLQRTDPDNIPAATAALQGAANELSPYMFIPEIWDARHEIVKAIQAGERASE